MRRKRLLRWEIKKKKGKMLEKKNASKSEIGCEGIIRLVWNGTKQRKKGTHCTGTEALKARHNQGTI